MSRRFVAAMTRRELRTSRRRFALYGSCMALGIAALVGLHGLRVAVSEAVSSQSRRLLGGDLRLESRKPLAPELAARVDELVTGDADAADVTRFGSMVLAERSGRSRLVDVQGVAAGFPFYGEVLTEPSGLWDALQTDASIALVDASLLVQLDVAVGDVLRLGRADFRIAGSVLRAPGTFGLRSQLAPRVFIARAAVGATGLIQTGSMVDHILYLRAPAAALESWLDRHRSAFESARVRLKDVTDHQQDLNRSFGALTRYLGLVGLAALALGGVGVAAGVRIFVREKLDTVAVLRALGASSRDVLAVYTLLAMCLGAASGVIGAALGVGLQWLLPTLVSDLLPVAVAPSIEPAAIATGIGLGLWLTLLFAAEPLLDLGRVPPLRALRRDFSPEATTPGRGRRGLVVALGASLLAAALWQAPSPRVGLAFAAGLAATLAALAAAAVAAVRFLERHPIRRAPFWLRQGIANLFRPRNHTLATVLAVGFGLFVVSTLHAVGLNVLQQIRIDSRPDRPNLLLFDIQRDQLAAIERLVAERGAAIVDRAPIVSARIASIGGRAVSDRLAEPGLPRDVRWALGREYQLSYHAELRETERVAEGRWWGPEELRDGGTAAVSLESGIAEELGAAPGEDIVWDVQGVRVASVVTSIRDVDWGRLAANFFAVFPPWVLERAPQRTFLLLRLDAADARATLQRDVVGSFPNVSALDVSLFIAAAETLMREVGRAVRLLAYFTLATGFAILLATTATARHERTREVLLLRTLGASSRTVRRVVASEAIALGALAAAVGSGLALLAAWALIRFAFDLPFAPPLLDLAALALGTLLLTAALGGLGGRGARTRSPLAALRDAELGGAGSSG